MQKQHLPRFQPAFDLDPQDVIDAILPLDPTLFRALVTTARIEVRYVAYAVIEFGFNDSEFKALLDSDGDPDYSPCETLRSFFTDTNYHPGLGLIRQAKLPVVTRRTKLEDHLIPPFARATH